MNITDGKLILDATCGSRTIWFNKNHPTALYMDKREETCRGVWTSNARVDESERTLTVAPDIVADFTAMPFDDETFNLVVWDPPHLLRAGETSWMVKKYGKLEQDWPQMLRDGFRECMRVLKTHGVLIFKWNETQIPTPQILFAIGAEPLFGHRSGKRSQTNWMCFMKGI